MFLIQILVFSETKSLLVALAGLKFDGQTRLASNIQTCLLLPRMLGLKAWAITPGLLFVAIVLFFFLNLHTYLFPVFVFMHVSVFIHHVCMVRLDNVGTLFSSSSTLGVPRTQHRWSDLLVTTFICWATSWPLKTYLKKIHTLKGTEYWICMRNITLGMCNSGQFLIFFLMGKK